MSRERITVIAVVLLLVGVGVGSARTKRVKSLKKVAVAKVVQAADANAIVTGNNIFAFDLYGRLKDHPAIQAADGNLFFSPYSISTALAMTAGGAAGNTESQMASVLHLPDATVMHADSSEVLRRRIALAYGRLQKDLQAHPKDSGYRLEIANALWGQKGYPFLKSFLSLNKSAYGAGLSELDFGQPEQASKTINAWVEKKTQNKIKDLLNPNAIDPLTRLVLTNAVYFKGDWASQFDKARTTDANFFLAPDEAKTVQVPMMYQKGTFGYAETDTAQILALPYKGQRLSMILLLPTATSPLASVEGVLTAERFQSNLDKLRVRPVDVYLPRFKMTCGVLGLKDTLISMGMKDAFSERLADFSGMTGAKDLFIKKVLHKAFVEVNEEGTEAAGASAVIMNLRSAPMNPVFRADRPFVFLIRDNQTGSILFIGRMMNPAK